MPRASAMRSPPCCASNPAASASAKARCAGMVKTVGCSGLPTCDNRLGPGNGGGRTNVKPQPLMRDPVETSLLYRPVPEDIGGESVSRRIPQQAGRTELDARKDERRKNTGSEARNAARMELGRASGRGRGGQTGEK